MGGGGGGGGWVGMHGGPTVQRSHGFTDSTKTSFPMPYSIQPSSAAALQSVTTMLGLKRFIGKGFSRRSFSCSKRPCTQATYSDDEVT